jgi:tetratricopeptide (TPR) repeat protein
VICSDDSSSEEWLQHAEELERDRKRRLASDAYLNAAQCYIEERKFSKAEDLLKRAVSLNSKKGEAWFQLGMLNLREHCYHSAKGYFKRAVQTRPNIQQHHAEYGVVLYSLREWDDAERVLRYALALDRTVRVLQFLGLTLAEKEEYQEALSLIHEAHHLAPEGREIKFSLGCVSFRSGDAEEALPLLQQSVEHPKHQRNKVKKRIRDALEIGKDRVETWMCLGDIYDSIDRRWEATIALEVATRVDPKHARAWYELSEIHLDYHLHDDARDVAYLLDPKDPDILCSTAVGFYEAGMKKEALDTFWEVLVLDSEHSEAQRWIDDIEEEFTELEEMGECPRLGEYGASYDPSWDYDY